MPVGRETPDVAILRCVLCGKNCEITDSCEEETAFLPFFLSSFLPSFLLSLCPSVLLSFPPFIPFFLPPFLPSVFPSFFPFCRSIRTSSIVVYTDCEEQSLSFIQQSLSFTQRQVPPKSTELSIVNRKAKLKVFSSTVK